MGKRGAQPWEPPSIKDKNGKEFGSWIRFDELLASQATLKDLASFYSVSEDTIERAVKRVKKMKFAEYFAQKSPVGRISLRWMTYKRAMAGDKTAMVILWKKWFGLADKVVVKDQTTRNDDDGAAHAQIIERLETLFNEMKSEPKEDDRDKKLGLIAQKLGIGT